MIDEFPASFTGPIRMAELPDGRVLASDAREGRLVVLDFASGAQVSATTRGDGPLEYRTGFRFASAGDSAWMFDLMRGRILVFSPAGSPVSSFDVTDGASQSRISAPRLLAVMSNGDWYGDARGMSIDAAGAGFAESTAVVRVRATADSDPVARESTRDTLAMLRADGLYRPNADGTRRLSQFDPYDLAAVFSDGRVLVVRGERYETEVVMPDGTRRMIGPVSHDRMRLGAAELKLVVDSLNRLSAGLIAMSMAQLPVPAGSAPRAPGLVAPRPAPEWWPVLMAETIPVDTRDRAWVAVRDSSLATLGQRYDLIDREGVLVGAVRVPPRYELVGFGAEHLFVARRDADDLLWLQRYALP